MCTSVPDTGKIGSVPSRKPLAMVALVRRQLERLREDRADGAAGHDDRSLGAERTTGADADRRRDGLQDRHARLNPAAAGEDGLDGLGHAVPADLLRSEAGHQSHDQPADHRGQQNQQWCVVVSARRYQRRVPPLVEHEVGDQSDEPQ